MATELCYLTLVTNTVKMVRFSDTLCQTVLYSEADKIFLFFMSDSLDSKNGNIFLLFMSDSL